MKKILIFILDWTWCFPQTFLGFILTNTIWIKKSVRYTDDLNLSEDFNVILTIGLSDKKGRIYDFLSGFSLGRYICLKWYDNDEWIIRHECGHTRQSRMLGWLYLIVVGVPSVYGNILSRYNTYRAEHYYEYFPEKWANDLGGNNK